MNIPEEGENKLTEAKLQGYAAVLSIGSTRCKANLLGSFAIFLCFFKIMIPFVQFLADSFTLIWLFF